MQRMLLPTLMVIIIPIQSQWGEFGSQPAGRRFLWRAMPDLMELFSAGPGRSWAEYPSVRCKQRQGLCQKAKNGSKIFDSWSEGRAISQNFRLERKLKYHTFRLVTGGCKVGVGFTQLIWKSRTDEVLWPLFTLQLRLLSRVALRRRQQM